MEQQHLILMNREGVGPFLDLSFVGFPFVQAFNISHWKENSKNIK